MPKFDNDKMTHHKQNHNQFHHSKDLRIHDVFLNYCRKEKIEVAVEMRYQVKKTGLIVGFDQQVIVMACQNDQKSICQQMLYKDSVLSINPILPVNIIFSREDQHKIQTLQSTIPIYKKVKLNASSENTANFS